MKKSDVAYLAKLASIPLSAHEESAIASDLTKTLEAIDTLSEIDTTGVDPTFQTTGNKNRFQSERQNDRIISIQKPFTVTTHYFDQ